MFYGISNFNEYINNTIRVFVVWGRMTDEPFAVDHR